MGEFKLYPLRHITHKLVTVSQSTENVNFCPPATCRTKLPPCENRKKELAQEIDVRQQIDDVRYSFISHQWEVVYYSRSKRYQSHAAKKLKNL